MTRYEDGLEVSRLADKFSNDPKFNIDRQVKPRMVPIEYDPPEHTDLRRILNPVFTPAAVRRMADGIRTLAIELIDQVLLKGGCDFVTEIARRFPITLFLRMANAPLEHSDFLLSLADGFLRGKDPESRARAKSEMGTYLKSMLAERAQNPGDDIVSLIATASLPDRALTDDEREGYATLAFFGGLDTVMATLSFIMHTLGRNPDVYAGFVANPATIEHGLEELIRLSGTNCTPRGISHDFTFKGIDFRTGDRLVLVRPVMGVDDRSAAEPETIDLTRTACPHLAFGAGPHRCLGSHLARAEMRIFLEEWTKRIPHFTVDYVEMQGGIVWAPAKLRLAWTPPG